MNNYIKMINKNLDEYLEIHYPEIILEAIRYSVFAGGKRVRSLLMLLSNKALSGEIEKVLPFASAVELIHTYSLIHDDLPAMDDDEYRRGKLTNHKVYGEALAILSGDAILNKAYEIMGTYCEENFNVLNIKAMNKLSSAAGVRGMIGGQVMDVLSEGQDINHEILDFIYENKTAALFKASMGIGAGLAGADEEMTNKFELAGQYLGMAFQIKDDILDVESSFEHLGKPIGSDVKNSKNTFVKIYGIEKAKEEYDRYSTESLNLLLKLNLENTDIIEYIKEMLKRTN